jgi:radical SAM protein (TIGR01212 family)
MTSQQYRTFGSFLRDRFGQRVQKITLDAGLTCPHRNADKTGGCIYCNAQGSGTGAASKGNSLKEQIESQIESQSRRYKAKAFIAYFQSYTNTFAPIEELKRIYDSVLPYPEIVGISIGTRPDCVNPEILDLISSYSEKRLVWMEYGLQSSNDETLKWINRGHDAKAFSDAVKMTSERGLRTCAHIIIGLPGETQEDWLATARFVAWLPVTDIKIHLMYVVKNTPLETLYNNGDYKPLTLEEYAEGTARFIACLPPDMVIQRITGDPHPEELVVPLWSLEKKKVLSAVHDTMNQLGLYQGKNYIRKAK